MVSSVTTKKQIAARDEVTRALNTHPIRSDQEITLGYLREAMVLAFIAGAEWHAAQPYTCPNAE